MGGIIAGEAVIGELRPDRIALVIADAWHGQGLGRRLLEFLLEHARDAGAREAEGVVLAINRPMLRLAASVGFSLKADPEDATIVRIRRRLDDANDLSL